MNWHRSRGLMKRNDPEGQKIQKALREEAVALASEYDDVIFVGGLNHDTDEEAIRQTGSEASISSG